VTVASAVFFYWSQRTHRWTLEWKEHNDITG